MAEKIARDMESLATRDSILRITSADYDATTPGRLSATDDTGVVKIRPYERTVYFTTATASGTIEARMPDAGLCAGKIFHLYCVSVANSKTVTVKDASGYVTIGAMTTTADEMLLYSNGLVWRAIIDVTT
jgi:hypothetical protein